MSNARFWGEIHDSCEIRTIKVVKSNWAKRWTQLSSYNERIFVGNAVIREGDANNSCKTATNAVSEKNEQLDETRLISV